MSKRPSLIIFTRKHVNLPALLAHKLQRYSMMLIVAAFVLIGFNFEVVTRESVLWFMAGLCAAMAVLYGVATTILDAIAWNFERLRDELGFDPGSIEIDKVS